MKRDGAFSLVEVTLAIGIVGFALLAIFALIPVGLTAGRDSIDATRSSLIAQDLKIRAQVAATSTVFGATSDVALGPWFYDREGVYVENPTSNSASVLYRVTGFIHATWNAAPQNVDATVLRPVTAVLTWPANPSTQNVVGNHSIPFTFYVRRP